MHPAVQTRIESPRGCGYRRPGLYLVADGLSMPCGKMPIPLRVCPTCHSGIHQCRGWTWINGDKFVKKLVCQASPCPPFCPLREKPGMVGLLWIGNCYYPTPEAWMKEAERMGVSRRISQVPKKFVVGKTWVWVAHAKTIKVRCPACDPAHVYDRPICKKCKGAGTLGRAGVFHAFKPSRIEYVVKDGDSDEKIESLVRRGITPVKVIRDIDANLMFNEG
jgi:hypothetical protein